MSDNFIRDQLEAIRSQLEAIQFAVIKPPRMHPKAKAPPKMAYGWFKRSWPESEFRAMLLEHMPSIDDTLDDPTEVYKGLSKDEKALVRELFEAQRSDREGGLPTPRGPKTGSWKAHNFAALHSKPRSS